MIERVFRASTVIAVALSLVACGGGRSDMELGIRQIALELAFQHDDAATVPDDVALPPTVPPLPDYEVRNGQLHLIQPSPVAVSVCAPAPAGATPRQPVAPSITSHPAAGTYRLSNVGTIAITGGAFDINAPYPAETRKEIAHVTDETTPPSALGDAGERVIEFDVVKPLGSTIETDRLRITAAEMALVRREVKTDSGTIVFEPSSPITLMKLGSGEGSSWTAAGADLDTGAAMTIEGSIEKREAVDVCGEVVDTYRVRSSERIASLGGKTPFTMETNDNTNAPGSDGPGKPNFYNVSTNHGGLFLVEETHTTLTIANIVLKIDNVARQLEVDPMRTTT